MVVTMSHLLCSLLPSHASFGMGSWSTSCRRIGAWKGLMRLAADSLTLQPCAGSNKACLMSACVLIFFTAFRGCWIFPPFFFHLFHRCYHTYSIAPVCARVYDLVICCKYPAWTGGFKVCELARLRELSAPINPATPFLFFPFFVPRPPKPLLLPPEENRSYYSHSCLSTIVPR